jgi:hypothetical protein
MGRRSRRFYATIDSSSQARIGNSSQSDAGELALDGTKFAKC